MTWRKKSKSSPLRKSVEVVYLITRAEARTGNAPQVMATLRNTTICLLHAAVWHNIAEANRHIARDETRPLTLLQT